MKDQLPPKIIVRLLRKIIHPDLWESVEGDLNEMYMVDRVNDGRFRSGFKFILASLAFLRYRRLQKRKYSKTQNTMDIYSNYLKVSFRNLSRNKLFSAINISGLAVGLTATILILQYVVFENGFDRFHNDFEKIYRVYNDRFQNGELVQHGTITYPTIGPQLLEDYPEVIDYTRMTSGPRNYLTLGEEVFVLEDNLIADERFFDFFSFPLVSGEISSVLDEPGKIALSSSYASRLLEAGENIQDLVGKSVRLNTYDFPCTISGIFQDVPSNSHLQFEALISYKTFIEVVGEGADNSWEWSDFYHYIKLREGTDPKFFQAKLDDFGDHYFKNGEVSGAQEEFFIQPLRDIRLYSDFEYEIGSVSNGKLVWLMLAVSLFILMIAWINYINLTTSAGIERMKEVSVRKVLGAYKGQIIRQFITESIVVNTISLLLAFLLVSLIQPYFNQLTEMDLEIGTLFSQDLFGIPFIVVFILIFILGSLFISIYPSLALSRYSFQVPHESRNHSRKGRFSVRKGLVVFQFITAIVLISCSLTVNKQISYMQDQELGFDMDNTIEIYGPRLTRWDSTWIVNFNSFRQSLLSVPGIAQVSSSGRSFGERMGKIFSIKSPAAPEIENISCNFMNSDYEFFDLFSVKLVAGRTFTKSDHNVDGDLINTVVINESAAKVLHFSNPQDALNKKISFFGGEFEIVGVVKDYHQRGLKLPILPIIFLPYYSTMNYITVKLEPMNLDKTLVKIEEAYHAFYPGNNFDYFFVKDRFNQEYQEDEVLADISKLFTVLAVLIGFLGLYGLVLMTLNSKIKEIGIRKVLGASLINLILTVGLQFILLVIPSIVIGLPISYFLIEEWMSGYEYNMGIDWSLFVLSIIGVTFLILITIFFQIGKISRNNPVESLKYE